MDKTLYQGIEFMLVDAIIIARGGSKGLPNKNIVDLCGKPLICWTIEQCLASKYIRDIWVSSDNSKILDLSSNYKTKLITRPKEISGDTASSESAWLHALEKIEEISQSPQAILAPQVTSPLREAIDIDKGIEEFKNGSYDSLFSANAVEDLFFWEETSDNSLRSVNYDYRNRARRQDIRKRFIENGSFYIFSPEIIKKHENRFGGKIGLVEMEPWKMLEIDSREDLRMCSALMKEYLVKNDKT